jgi:hypothetical protein
VRPAIFYIIEDVVAVDGNGGIEYREAFNARYEGSETFRKMLWNLSVCWMLAFYILGAAVAVLVVLLPKESVYAVGWAAPFPVAGVMVIGTIFYVRGVLKVEGKGEDEGHENGDGIAGSRPIEDERAPLLNGSSR